MRFRSFSGLVFLFLLFSIVKAGHWLEGHWRAMQKAWSADLVVRVRFRTMVMVVLFLNAGKDHIKNKVAMAISKSFFFQNTHKSSLRSHFNLKDWDNFEWHYIKLESSEKCKLFWYFVLKCNKSVLWENWQQKNFRKHYVKSSQRCFHKPFLMVFLWLKTYASNSLKPYATFKPLKVNVQLTVFNTFGVQPHQENHVPLANKIVQLQIEAVLCCCLLGTRRGPKPRRRWTCPPLQALALSKSNQKRGERAHGLQSLSSHEPFIAFISGIVVLVPKTLYYVS